MVKEYLEQKTLTEVRRFTCALYNYPPAVWLRFTYKGEQRKTPKITTLDIVILSFLASSCEYNPDTKTFSFVSSVNGIAKVWGKEKKRIRESLKRLEQSGAIKMALNKTDGRFTRYEVRHFEPTDLKPILIGLGIEKYCRNVKNKGGQNAPLLGGKGGQNAPPKYRI